MGADDRIDECEAESVTVGLLSLHSSFEQVGRNLRRKPRTVVFEDEHRQILFSQESNRHRAGCGKMLELVIEEVCNHAMDEGFIPFNLQRTNTAKGDMKARFCHAWLVEVDHDSNQCIKIDLAASKSQRIRLGLSHIE